MRNFDIISLSFLGSFRLATVWFIGRAFVLDVLGHSSSNFDVNHLHEECEPVVVQEAHSAKHNSRNGRNDDKHVEAILPLLLFDCSARLDEDKDVVDHVWQHYHARVGPDNHVGNHTNSSSIAIYRHSKEFSSGSSNICDIMEEGDGDANWNTIGVAHAEQQRDCTNVVHQHFEEVICSIFQEYKHHHVTSVVSNLKHRVSHSSFAHWHERGICHHSHEVWGTSTEVIGEPGFVLQYIVTIRSGESEIKCRKPVFTHLQRPLSGHFCRFNSYILDVRQVEVVCVLDDPFLYHYKDNA